MLPSTLACLTTKEAQAIIKLALPEPPPESEPKQEDERKPQTDLPKHPILHGLGSVGAGLLSFGAGALTGYGGAELIRRGLEHGGTKIPLKPLMYAMPALTGMSALAYSAYQNRQIEELKRALESYRNQSSGSNSGA